MADKNNCDAYDSGYCYLLGRPLTDEEDDFCEEGCYYNLLKNRPYDKELKKYE